MYTVLLAGGIGSGKSSVARELEALGCHRIDLDQLSREVLAAWSPTTRAVADAFGQDLLDPGTGELDRPLLAARAFRSAEQTALLESIELPAIRALLGERVERLAASEAAPAICLIEVPLLDRIDDLRALADEVVVVVCPMGERRRRAVARGMTATDFDARAARQPSDEWLRAHADTVIDNAGTPEQLRAAARAWYAERGMAHGS